MMYNNYYKKDIIIVPKSKQNNINILNKNDIKLKKNKSYDNIRDIVINKKDIEIIDKSNTKKNIYKIF